MMNYYMSGLRSGLILFSWCLLSSELSYSLADENKKTEFKEALGVMIVSLDLPLRATIGNKVIIEIVIGNERTTKVTTILTVTCLTTNQIIDREAETLDSLSSQKIVYTWNTEGLKEDTYIIRAELEKIPREANIDDNVKEVSIFLIP
ncbi:MAG TPA: hypothetical protein ACFYD4_07430 [Candidatus Wunengus sp. YC61]|uniref:hypothetical protein n=1 Tax=Candidatus Wunengus sp. YC61 TaxID=3367698 RepID=UPI0040257A9A